MNAAQTQYSSSKTTEMSYLIEPNLMKTLHGYVTKILRAASQRATLLPHPTNDALSPFKAESLAAEQIWACSPSSLVLSAIRSETSSPILRSSNQRLPPPLLLLLGTNMKDSRNCQNTFIASRWNYYIAVLFSRGPINNLTPDIFWCAPP